MNSLAGYMVFKVLPALVALLYSCYLAFVISSPARLKTAMSRPGVYRKFYNKQFLGAWICVSLFFISGIAFDAYRSAYTPPTFVMFCMLAFTIGVVFIGASLMGRALKK